MGDTPSKKFTGSDTMVISHEDLKAALSENENVDKACTMVCKDHEALEKEQLLEKDEAQKKTETILNKFNLNNISHFSFRDEVGNMHNVEIVVKTLLSEITGKDVLILLVKEKDDLYKIALGKENKNTKMPYALDKTDIFETKKDVEKIRNLILVFNDLLQSMSKGWKLVSKSGTVREVDKVLQKRKLGKEDKAIEVYSMANMLQILLDDKTRDNSNQYNIDYMTTDELDEIIASIRFKFKKFAADKPLEDEYGKNDERSMINVLTSISAYDCIIDNKGEIYK